MTTPLIKPITLSSHKVLPQNHFSDTAHHKKNRKIETV
jgi:hypothetical protein